MSNDMPPLPLGWTQHIAPTGHLYYHHSQTNTSTYTHPALAAPPPPAPPQISLAAASSSADPLESAARNVAKEKPRQKVPIPGAPGWLRVTTNKGNVFYFHSHSKRSEWTAPEEIKSQIAALQQSEAQSKAIEESKSGAASSSTSTGAKPNHRFQDADRDGKRRADEGEIISSFEAPARAKKARFDLQVDGKDGDEEEEEEEEEDGAPADSQRQGARSQVQNREASDDEDEGDDAWQIAMAAEMAAEAEQLDQGDAPPSGAASTAITRGTTSVETAGPESQASHGDRAASLRSAAPNPTFLVKPPSVELSHDEAKALFMHMLTSLNGSPNEVNPMAPWDKELPKFVHQPSYSVLPQLKDRQDAFNEWCKLRIREKRASKASDSGTVTFQRSNASSSSTGNGPPAQTAASASSSVSALQYRQLLEAEVKSTRTRFDDFRKTWRKDRRFFDFGRDDREREKAFRGWLTDLGERKRKAALAAESDFLDLLTLKLPETLSSNLDKLKSSHDGNEKAAVTALWQEAKRTPSLDTDSRYEAVGSSTRRAELFGEWVRGRRRADGAGSNGTDVSRKEAEAEASKPFSKEDLNRKALREREEKVRRAKTAIDARNRAAFGAATREESQIQFNQLLLDAIRDPLSGTTLSSAVRDRLAGDPRYDAPGLSHREREELYENHIRRLVQKQKAALRDVFRSHAAGLDAEKDDVLARTREDPRLEGVSLRFYLANPSELSQEYDEWLRDWRVSAQRDFQDMLKESAFVEFWGRMRQEALSKGEKGAADKADQAGEDDEDQVDLADMAKKVDLDEIEAILRNDQRFRLWKHVPHKREEWIRDHLAALTKPKKSVYQQD